MNETLDQINRCTECEVCMEVCPTYTITGQFLFSPMHRLKTAKKLFEGEEVDEQMIESLYNCAECMRCEAVCPEETEITKIVGRSRSKLFERGLGPLDKHNKVIEGIHACMHKKHHSAKNGWLLIHIICMSCCNLITFLKGLNLIS